jgi:hypothetical protein
MKILCIKIIALSALLSMACTIKVSEWVLLNAVPGQYTLVYLHKNANTEKIIVENAALTKSFEGANIKFRDVVKEDAVQPYYALYYGNRLFSRYDETAQLKNFARSPVREKIAGMIMSGKLCVLLYLKTGDNIKDEKGMNAVRKAVAESPFGKTIELIELNRNDRDEVHLVSMLLNVESDLKNLKDPMLFGIFGKFKALEPLVGAGITEENINYMIEFFTADCSCLIKDDLPGTDILYAGSWDSPAVAQVNAILDANPLLQHR